MDYGAKWYLILSHYPCVLEGYTLHGDATYSFILLLIINYYRCSYMQS